MHSYHHLIYVCSVSPYPSPQFTFPQLTLLPLCFYFSRVCRHPYFPDCPVNYFSPKRTLLSFPMPYPIPYVLIIPRYPFQYIPGVFCLLLEVTKKKLVLLTCLSPLYSNVSYLCTILSISFKMKLLEIKVILYNIMYMYYQMLHMCK